MILNQTQAEAVYSALCALNNVSYASGINLSFVGDAGDDLARLHVTEDAGGCVRVSRGGGALEREREDYINQSAFAAAYGLLKPETDKRSWMLAADALGAG